MDRINNSLASPKLQTFVTCGLIINAWFSPAAIAWVLWFLAGAMVCNVALGHHVANMHDTQQKMMGALNAMADELDRRQAEIDRLTTNH